MRSSQVNTETARELRPIFTNMSKSAYLMRHHSNDMVKIVQTMTHDEQLSEQIVKEAIDHLARTKDFSKISLLLNPWLKVYTKYYTISFLKKNAMTGDKKYANSNLTNNSLRNSARGNKNGNHFANMSKIVDECKNVIHHNFLNYSNREQPIPAA